MSTNVAAMIDQADVELRDVSSSARLDAELLLAAALHTNRTGLYQHLERRLTAAEQRRFAKLVELRLRDYPVAYLLGQQEFFGYDFQVDPRTLIPRPLTEALVSEATRRWPRAPIRLVDIGTGSGAIIVSLARELPVAALYASDVSREALDVAKENAERLGVGHRIEWRAGDLLEPWLNTPLDVVIANLPYLPQSAMTEPSIAHEPPLALQGGADGLEIISRFVAALASRADISTVILESLPQQIETISYMLRHVSPEPFEVSPLLSYGQPAGVIGHRSRPNEN